MLFRFAYRCTTEVSWRLLFKAARLWCFKGLLSLRAYKKRTARGVLFPPFLFFSLTNACNLRCRGCWVAPPERPDVLPLESMERVIEIGRTKSVYFYTLLGGEPFLAPTFREIVERHPEVYFQVITNGQFFTPETVRWLRHVGNVSPLVSLDGPEEENDRRRGAGTFANAIEGCRELQRQKILYGAATVVTESNFESVMTEDYVRRFIDLGAMYLWYYVFRPVGPDPSPELVLGEDRLVELRTRLLALRRRMPIILIDTYWDARGRAVCPASKGMAFQIGPRGSIEPCPPLAVARDYLADHGGDFYKTVDQSGFLRRFQQLVRDRYEGDDSQGCMILDAPGELAAFFRREQVADLSGRDLLAELDASPPRSSHYLPGRELPEDYWVYRFLKKTLFFGMGAYG